MSIYVIEIQNETHNALDIHNQESIHIQLQKCN